jgi:hypothetical protein
MRHFYRPVDKPFEAYSFLQDPKAAYLVSDWIETLLE